MIVLGREWHLSYFLHEKPLPPATSANSAVFQAAEGKFAALVESNPATATDKPYQLVRWFGEDAALLLRRDLIEQWRRVPAAGSHTIPGPGVGQGPK